MTDVEDVHDDCEGKAVAWIIGYSQGWHLGLRKPEFCVWQVTGLSICHASSQFSLLTSLEWKFGSKAQKSQVPYLLL